MHIIYIYDRNRITATSEWLEEIEIINYIYIYIYLFSNLIGAAVYACI